MEGLIRIVVADDHLVVREGIVTILATHDKIEVVAEAATGRQALDHVCALEPDVLLLDLQMPELSGVEVIREIRARDLKVGILVFTAFDADDLIIDAVRAGLDGYLLKGAGRDELFAAIETVAAGGSLLQPAVASKLLASVGSVDPTVTLTPRETEVLSLLSRGLSNKEIAAVLSITERTAKFHVSSLLKKLDSENRTEALSRAIQLRLIDL